MRIFVNKRPTVEVDSDHITIKDSYGEIVHWVDDEWEEDPSIVPAIANAVVIALSGTQDLREVLNKPIVVDTSTEDK